MAHAEEAKGLLSINSEHRIRSENLAFDMDVWYPRLKQFTFRSEFLPLTRTEALAIIHYQDVRYREKKEPLSSEEVATLDNLERRIDRSLRLHFLSPESVPLAFMRLCGRSPKDAEPLDREDLVRKYTARLHELTQEQGAPLEANTKLRAIARVSALCVSSGAHAMSLLLTSERVFTDLHDWIRWGEPEQIVLREYAEISMEYEFRAFVNNNRITAISQYDHYCIYPDLAAMKDRIQTKIQTYWEEVHPHVGEASYVIDFAYFPDRDDIIVIEISPFLDCTGTACFSWKNDRELLENGPLQFRLNTRSHPHIEQLVQANWEDRWNGQVPAYRSFYPPHLQSTSGPEVSWKFLVPFFAFMPSLFLGLKGPASVAPLFMSAAAVCGAVTLYNVWTKPLPSPPHRTTHLMFFYGTLKQNCHWNKKFLSQSKFVSRVVSVDPLPLVVGACGVPYLLDLAPDDPSSHKFHHVRGELWEVDSVTRQNLDEYEGVSKGYYTRKTIRVREREGEAGRTYEPEVYCMAHPSPSLIAGPFIEEYTLDFHRAHYNAIRHILVKQKKYLDMPDAESIT
eukprot:TRINITY_DN10257_c0_g1_i3.p1 TRINITY_DN10257_c0_g1~~TRINITY_DN10257_c0_g1_i3.p1  ORF type:complete len:566 (+),score=106.24 TRINITY_DN10257_c0_g1_i3:1-1698(+)